MLMANSAASFTLCRTRNVPSERLVRMLSAPARSMGPAYLPRHIKEVHRVPAPGPPLGDVEATLSSNHCDFFFFKLVTAWVRQPLDTALRGKITYQEGSSSLGLTLKAEPSSRCHTGQTALREKPAPNRLPNRLPTPRACHWQQGSWNRSLPATSPTHQSGSIPPNRDSAFRTCEDAESSCA